LPPDGAVCCRLVPVDGWGGNPPHTTEQIILTHAAASYFGGYELQANNFILVFLGMS
jgi:hypothetical protein